MNPTFVRPASRRVATAIVLLAVAAALACCAHPAPVGPGRTIQVTLRDFKLEASIDVVPAGLVRLVLHNRGPSTHEFVVVRTDHAANALPILPDGLTVDEEASSITAIGEDHEVLLGNTDDLDVRLTPGHYVLFCNLNGHYLGGMRLSLTVR